MGFFKSLFKRGKDEEQHDQTDKKVEHQELLDKGEEGKLSPEEFERLTALNQERINELTEESIASGKKAEEEISTMEDQINSMNELLANAPGSRAMHSIASEELDKIMLKVAEKKAFRDSLRVEPEQSGSKVDAEKRAEDERPKYEPGTVGAMLYEFLGKERMKKIEDSSKYNDDDVR